MCTERKKRALPPSINTPFKQQIKPKINVTAEQTLRGPLQLIHTVPRQKQKPSVYSLAEPEQSFIIVSAF